MTAKIVAFYAFKGGTGRSFSLAHTAWSLARLGHRAVVVDLDLAAPSMWALLSSKQVPAPGVVEFIRAWPTSRRLQVRDLLEDIPLDPKARGALFLLQAGTLDAEYLRTLQEIDWAALVAMPPPAGGQLRLFGEPLSELFGSIQESVEPDVILIDAPTGFNDTSNLCLRVLADLVVVVFAPARAQLEGIGRVVASLTAEVRAHGRPDVFCAASTILLSRVGGPQVKKIHDAFDELARVRYQAIDRPQRLSPEDEDRVYQEPAVISYDERLADLERLPTETEPREGHFSSFHDVIDYVRGALPAPRPRLELDELQKRGLLEELLPSFELFAEQGDTTRLEQVFLRTSHLEQVREKRVVLILGGKGSGKTALYMFMTGQRDLGAVAAHGPGSGVSQDLLVALLSTVPSFDVAWRVLLLTRVAPSLLTAVHDPAVQEMVEGVRDLQRSPERLSQVSALLNQPDASLRIDRAWRELDGALLTGRGRLTLCVDGLDIAFKSDPKQRDRGLTSLFTAWQATFSSLLAVEVKIFLRTDLWDRLSFAEKSHLRGRELRLTWTGTNLWRLVVKRCLISPKFKAWTDRCLPAPGLDPAQAERVAESELHPYLDLFFEKHIWTGKNSLSRSWALRRLQDARGATFPRDLICLFKEALDLERQRQDERQRVAKDAVLSRQSLAEALPPTSKQRVDAVVEELPELADVFPLLRGLAANGSREMLEERLIPNATAGIDLLVEAGVLKLEEDGSYFVPNLYRHGLEMQRPGPR